MDMLTILPFFSGFISAAWKIIKSWLPAGAVKKIKFLSKANIGEYVAEDQRPPAWGGKRLFSIKVLHRIYVRGHPLSHATRKSLLLECEEV